MADQYDTPFLKAVSGPYRSQQEKIEDMEGELLRMQTRAQHAEGLLSMSCKTVDVLKSALHDKNERLKKYDRAISSLPRHYLDLIIQEVNGPMEIGIDVSWDSSKNEQAGS
jgi:hypothetical protein